MKPSFQSLPPHVLAVLTQLDTPEKIQVYIDAEIGYDPYREDRSLVEVVSDKKAECFNGALLAVACLQFHGYPAAIIELMARGGDEEHMLCVYKHQGGMAPLPKVSF